ncbi:hypothetical protein BC628DRAFT_1414179 [Trametes gibbosa]|nr:hypothetical protein C2E23DRAFT_888260 [Lenzites betulinus]KAI0833367.1 hypothetical protein BC628DRAFT_1414179 [Trametes gibbosa]
MSSQAELQYLAVKERVSTLKILQMTLDVELRTLLDEHRLSPLQPLNWIAELAESLRNRNADFLQQFIESVLQQSRKVKRLLTPADFEDKVSGILQAEAELSLALSEIEDLFSRSRSSMTGAQRSFFEDLISTTRQAFTATAAESRSAHDGFKELVPRIEFLYRPQEDLRAFLRTIPPYAPLEIIQFTITPAIQTLQELAERREVLVARADGIEFDALQRWHDLAHAVDWEETSASLEQLRKELKAQRELQSAALAIITLETTTANGAVGSLPSYPGPVRDLSDLLCVAEEYRSVERLISLLEELQGQIRTAVERVMAKLSRVVPQ